MSEFSHVSNDDELPTVRDVTSSCNQAVNDFLGIVLLALKTLLQTFVMISTVTKSFQNMHNVVMVQASRVFSMVVLNPLGWSNSIVTSDIYHMSKFLNRLFFSMAVSYHVLKLKNTYVWQYYLEHVIVPIVTVSIPLQICINRQLLGPPFHKQGIVKVTLWVCNSILLYFIFTSFLNVHIHHLHYQHVEGQDPETRVVLNEMGLIHLLALMEVPINLAIVASKAMKVDAKNYQYSKVEKNVLVANVLYQCTSPIIGFVVCFRSRSGVVYPLLFLSQLFSWGNCVVSLAVYISYESMISETFPTLTESEVLALSDDDVCPMCLVGHSTESCRLACNHLVHSSCLISLMQVSMSTAIQFTKNNDVCQLFPTH